MRSWRPTGLSRLDEPAGPAAPGAELLCGRCGALLAVGPATWTPALVVAGEQGGWYVECLVCEARTEPRTPVPLPRRRPAEDPR